MKGTLLHFKVISSTWLTRLFFRLGEYFFDIDQAARIDEWKAKHPGVDVALMGWVNLAKKGA